MNEMEIEKSIYYVHLTRLIAREDFIKFTRRESTKTYHEIHNFADTWSRPVQRKIRKLFRVLLKIKIIVISKRDRHTQKCINIHITQTKTVTPLHSSPVHAIFFQAKIWPRITIMGSRPRRTNRLIICR
jgi:hypothetical protein